MQNPSTLLNLFRIRGVVRPRDIKAHGLHRTELAALLREGKLKKLGRGLYALADRESTGETALATIAIRYPDALFCLLTALQIHGLTTQSPHQVWIAIDPKARAPSLDYPPLRVVRFSGAALTFGATQCVVDGGVPIRVTTVAKTVADCFKYRNKIGLDVALEALRDAWSSKKVTIDALMEAAQVCRVSKVMRPYLDSIV